MLEDRYGMPLTTTSPMAVDLYVLALDRFLAQRSGVDGLARRALEHDDQFAFAWLLLALDQQQREEAEGAAESMARVHALAKNMDDRERSAVSALAQIGVAPLPQAESALRQHLDRWPRDVLVLMQAAFFYGIRDSRADRVARHLRLYEDVKPAYGDDWFFLGQYAFGCEEDRQYQLAEELAQRSLEANSQNAAAAHAYAHVLLETGQPERGAQWLEEWLTAWKDPG